MGKEELSVFLAGGRMFESQKGIAKSNFLIEKLNSGDWEISLKMTVSSNEATNSLFNFEDLKLEQGVKPADVSNLIFINNLRANVSGVLQPNKVEPSSNKILIGGKPNSANGSANGVIVQFTVELPDAGKTDQGGIGKTDQGGV